eukprot:TRINITY_DN3491_c0_g1_i2.p1 TRINITY_DN3491_c0_g1~~TRINITY_DN3491_c0_g1_i2.p1  ORF type:complete len:420 (-),score=134.07 TRINITY_DN3491_c0_g1_i2:269-1528(-)
MKFLLFALLLLHLSFASDLILPEHVASVIPGQKVEFSPDCFQHTTAILELKGDGGILTIEASKPASVMCSDFYLMTTGKQWSTFFIFRNGTHHDKFSSWKPGQLENIEQYGLQLFRISSHILPFFKQLWEAYEIFARDDPEHIRKTLESGANFKFDKRETKVIFPAEDTIKSGDGLMITKFNKDEMSISLLSGSRAGHSAVFLRDPDTNEAYLVEAVPKYGLHKVPVNKWLSMMADGTDCTPETCMAVHLPLANDLVKHFDERKAWDYFKTVEGRPYMYNANLFANYDDPTEDALPKPYASPELLQFFGFIIDFTYPEISHLYFLDGMEKRLGVPIKDWQTGMDICRQRNMTMAEVWSIPEQDDWRYGDDDMPCIQCTSLVLRIYKAAGLMDHVLDCGSEGCAEHLINLVNSTPVISTK